MKETHNGTLDSVFYPASVAIVGASPGKSGQLFLDSLLTSRFQGKIYPVNPRGEEVSGVKAHTSLAEISGTVDYVICCIPAPAVPQLILDCAAKGVKAVSLFTAGYSESGTETGRKQEAELARLAHSTGVRLIGPNCLGAYSPKVGLAFGYPLPAESGRVAFACQSGGNSVYTIRAAGQRGVRFSKAISFGNACDINECELLEYLAQDSTTDAVAMYIEGVKDGPRFFRALKNLASVKPVAIHKGGYTPAGATTAASHTGSLAGSDQVWDRLLQQAGAIRVHSLEELVDMLVTFSFLPVPRGRRVVMFGGGGGATVIATDDWSNAGFRLPPIPQEVRGEISGFVTNDAGMMLSNPLDLSTLAYSQGFNGLVKRLLTYPDFADLAVVHIGFGHAAWFSVPHFGGLVDLLRDAMVSIHREVPDRPLVLAVQYLVNTWDWQKTLDDLQNACSDAGLPVYYSMASAARSIDRFMRYHERRQEAQER
ncbi:MAG: CoA-binding protein [Chloroflexi bacterium]|nr:CoA-binding protein [Chloroflexota bacterium]